MVLSDIIEQRYENLSSDETESVRQHLAARMNLLTLVQSEQNNTLAEAASVFEGPPSSSSLPQAPTADDPLRSGAKHDDDPPDAAANTLLAMVKKFINVREIDIDLIDSVNAFRERFEVASKTLDSRLLATVQAAMVAHRIQMTADEARTLWPRILAFRAQEGREPNVHATDPLEKRMAEALAWLKREKMRRLESGGAA
jgi:hypothetical protein